MDYAMLVYRQCWKPGQACVGFWIGGVSLVAGLEFMTPLIPHVVVVVVVQAHDKGVIPAFGGGGGK